MKKIIFSIQDKENVPDLAKLVRDCESHCLAVSFEEEELWATDAFDVLLVSDSEQLLKRAKRNGIAGVGYEREGSDVRISGVDMILMGFEEVTVQMLYRLWQRGHDIPWIIGETERIILRETVMEDFDALYDLCLDEGMLDYMPKIEDTREEERENLRSYIVDMYRFHGYGLWTVVEKATGKVIGRVGMEHETLNGGTVVEMGYMIGKAYQQRGYAVESGREALRYMEEEMEITDIYARIHEENTASQRVAERLGFARMEEPVTEGICWYKWLKK